MLASLRTNHIEWVLAKFLLSWKCMWHVWWGIQSVPSDLPALGGVSLTGSLTLTPTARDQPLERIQCQWGWLGLQALLYPPVEDRVGNVLELRPYPCIPATNQRRAPTTCSQSILHLAPLFLQPLVMRQAWLAWVFLDSLQSWSVWYVSTPWGCKTPGGILLVDLVPSWASPH